MLALILDTIPASVWAALGGLGAFVAALLGARHMGVKSAETEAAKQHAKKYQATRERMENAGNDDLSDDAVHQRLRDRAKR
jgi:gas vesicle protein